MTITLELLLTALMKRFAEAGFDIPEDMDGEQREAFVVQVLAEAAIVPADDYKELVAAGRQVVNRWESGDLAEAVRKLEVALPKLTGEQEKLEVSAASDK